MATKGKLFVVSGPSGVGKSCIVQNALERLSRDHDILRLVTYTSRPPREGEVPGKDYKFVSGEEFKQKQSEGFFLETVIYADHYYGSPVPSENDIELGKSFVYIVDIYGAKEIKKLYKDAALVWIDPPTIDVLKQRLEKRGTESAKQIEKRITQAKQEMEEAHNKSRVFGYWLVNDEFEQAVGEFILIIKRELEG